MPNLEVYPNTPTSPTHARFFSFALSPSSIFFCTTMETPSLSEDTTKAVLRQVEYYFGDSSLLKDDFLKKKISETEDGLVSLALICSFSKMKKHLNLMGVKEAEDVPDDTLKAVAETLRTSSSLKVSEDGKRVGRSSKLIEPEELIEQIDSRTIAASPFELNVKKEDLEAFFNQYAKVNSVRLPRHVEHKKLFCGTALIEFSADEDAEKVLEQSLVFAGAELELKPKKDFDAIRQKETEEFERNQPKTTSKEEKHPKGVLVAFTLKSISAGDSAEQNGSDEKKTAENEIAEEKIDEKHEQNDSDEKKTAENENTEEKIDDKHEQNGSDEKKTAENENAEEKIDDKHEQNGSDEKKAAETENVEEKIDDKHESPAEEVGKNERKSTASAYKDDMNVVLREDLKDIFKKFGTVKYIDFKMGEDKGYIRFDEPEAAQKAHAAAVSAEEGGLVVKSFIASLEQVTGDAEREYWSLLRGNQEKHRGNSRFHARGGKNNRGGKRGWGGENDSRRGRPKRTRAA